MLHLFSLCLQGIESEHWSLERKSFINKTRPVDCEAGKDSYPLGQTLSRFKHGMKIVFLKKFGFTKLHYIQMYVSALKFACENFRPVFGFTYSAGLLNLAKCRFLSEFQPIKH